MADFTADTAKVLNSSKEIVNMAVRLRELKNTLENVKLESTLSGSSGDHVDKAIAQYLDHISDEAVKMNTLGDALQVIADKYRSTEKMIEDLKEKVNLNTTSAEKNKETGTDKRNWWGKFWDWITKKEPDAYETTTDEQEKAADAAMKRKLWQVLQDEKYSQDNWDKASVTERKKILQDYMDEVIKIYDLQDVNPKIKWDSNATYSNQSITWGYYTHGYHSITLNDQALTDSMGNWDSYDLLETVSHELRHAYQHEAINHPAKYMVSQETIDIWKKNFDNYISSDNDYDGYRAQAVEADARDFQVNRNNYV